MNKIAAVVLGVVALVLIGAGVWFFGTGNEAPTDVTAPEISTTSQPEAAEDPEEPADPEAPEDTVGEGDTGEGELSGEVITFELADESQASFTIGEVLNGSPKTVLAVTPNVVGQVALDTGDLANSQVGTILVSARGFETDSASRNRAIRGPILDADAIEFIEFAPTSITGLEGTAEVGVEYSFTIEGDLTIRDTTLPVTFEVTATLETADRLRGRATTTVDRTDFGIQIPSVPSVADVDEEVPLQIDFVATPTA